MLTDLEKKIILAVQEDIPVEERPFLNMAKDIGITEEKFLTVLQDLCDRGVIRRLGATLRHQKSGFKANAMIAWQVDEDQVSRIGEIMASFIEVSHCYCRGPKPDWPYNLYTMVHAHDEASCLEIAGKMSEKAGVAHYTALFSQKELKKTSMKYFALDDDL